ncbi:hypothetical protein AMK59_4220, partial [Oryctes borbonicus]
RMYRESQLHFTIMDGFKAIVVLLLLTLACISAKPHWKQIVPEGKEIVYEYKALVKAATHIPYPFSSQFLLVGKLHLQLGSGNELWVRLDNLQYQLDNGRESEIKKSTMQTSDLAHITTPFKIVYEDNGIIKEIVTETNESEYALNMKKAIATVLQMNWEKVPLDSVKPFAFSTKEKSLFGHDHTLYNIMPASDVLKIYRVHYMKTSEHLYSNMMIDMKIMGCEASYEEPITHDTQKLYIIDRKIPNEYKLKYIETNGGIYFQPLQARSTAFYVYVNQTFKMLEMTDKKTQMNIHNEIKYTTLNYIVGENSIPFEKIDDPKTLIPVVENMLMALANYLEEDKITSTEPDMAKGQLVNRIVKITSHLDMTMLEELFTKLSSKTEEKDVIIFKMFQEIIPMIGTKSSSKFIMKLVQENKVKESVLIEMLQKMIFYVKVPTVQLLTDLEGLLHLTGASKGIQRTAVLSFSTLLYKLNEFNTRQGGQPINIEKYIQQLIDKLKTSKKIEEQYLLLDALYNMNNDLVIKYLEPLVKGEWFNDNRLRYKAMLAVSSVVTKHVHHDKMYELYWPIMTDTTLPAYMRIMAFYFVMKSKPNLSCQVNIYSFMQHEKDVDFLNFYHTYLMAFLESKNPCNYRSKLQAKQLLLYWPISYVHTLTQFRKFDVTDWKYNHGNTHDISFINTKEAMIFMWKMDVNVMNLQMTPNAFYTKITGVDKRLLDNVYLQLQKGMKYVNFDSLLATLAMNKFDNIQIEIIHMRYGQVIENHFFDKDTIGDMRTYFKIFYESQISETKSSLEIHYDMIIKMLVPTDIGLPVQFEANLPSIHETKTKLFKETANKITNINIDNKYRIMNYFSYGLSFHNPFASVWQGITKLVYVDLQVPIYLGMSLNTEQSTLKLSWKRHQDPSDDIIGYRSYAANYVYVIDYLNKDILQKITPTAKNFVEIGHSDNYKHNVSMLDMEEYSTGYKYTLRVFNDQNPKYYQRFPLAQDFFSGMEPYWQQLLKYVLHMKYLGYQHDIITERGIMFKMEPSTVNPATGVDLTMRFSNEIIDDSYALYLPAMKINAKATYVVKKDDKALKTWDINALWELNNAHTVNSLKLDITRQIPGQTDYKICAQGTEKYGDKDLTGHLTVTMGQSVDGKCNKDETAIHFTLKATQLPEQEQRIHNYEVCYQPIMPLIEEMRSYKCYADRSSLRYYTVDAKTVNFPKEFRNMLMNYWRTFLVKYQNYYIHSDEHSQDIAENAFRIQFRYPIARDIIDMRFITPMDTHKFKGLPAKDFERFGIYPDNLYYSNIHHLFHMLGLTNICIVDGKDLVTKNGTRSVDVITNDWTLLLGDEADNTKRGLWVKVVDDKLAVKAVLKPQTLLVTPTTGDKYAVTLNEKALNGVDNIYLDNAVLSRMEDSNTLVMFNRNTGVQLIYNGHQLLIEIPKTDLSFVGKCIKQQE